MTLFIVLLTIRQKQQLNLLKQSDTHTKMQTMQRQKGGNDCGLFAIAISVALAHNLDPAVMKFKQDLMRSHL